MSVTERLSDKRADENLKLKKQIKALKEKLEKATNTANRLNKLLGITSVHVVFNDEFDDGLIAGLFQDWVTKHIESFNCYVDTEFKPLQLKLSHSYQVPNKTIVIGVQK